MADINRARVSDPRLYYRRYRVAPAFMMISVSRTVPVVQTVATTIRLAGTIAHLFDNL